MSRNRRQDGRVTPKGTRPATRGKGGHRGRPLGEPSLVHDAGQRLRERSPFGLLALASSLIEAATERPADRWRKRATPSVSGSELFESFVEAGVGETEALALAVAALHPDELLARRLKDRIQVRGSVLRHPPAWLGAIDRIEVTDVAEMVETLGDGDNVMVAWRWPDGSAATAVVYIDHNMGTVVKDAFVIPEPFDVLTRTYHRVGLKDQEIRPIDPATARARVTEAIIVGERMVPPFETDSWPMCRPLLEWVLRTLPTGGEGHLRPEWSERQREKLLAEFIASPFAQAVGLAPAVIRNLADSLVWFGCDYGPGDPLRWSPVSVEIVLSDWYPRKVFGVEPEVMHRLPDVVEALVRFSHDQRQIPPYLTDETVAAVARWTPDFLEAVGRPGRSPLANAERLARIAAGFDPDDFDDDDWDDGDDWEQDGAADDSFEMEAALEYLESELVAEAGGAEALAALTDDPLPDEPFEWSGVPEQWRDATAATLDRLDQVATDLCDIEVRTMGRRMLAALVVGDKGLFKRSADADRLAVAIIWVICDRMDVRRGALGFGFRTQKALSAATGVPASAISSRSKTVGNTLDRLDFDWTLALHSSRRRTMLETRQMIADWRLPLSAGD
jgi:hypothetical protein